MLKLILNPLSLIEQVKQPSPSVKPASQLLFKLGKIKLFLVTTGSNLIFPLLAQRLKPLINLSHWFLVVGNTTLPLKRLRIISISLLLCVTYLLHFIDCDITLPKPKVSCIYCKTFISLVLCRTCK